MSDFIYVESDNFTGVMTQAAYRELRLQMSTGDFHVHKHCPALPSFAAFYGYTDFDWATDMFDDYPPEAARA